MGLFTTWEQDEFFRRRIREEDARKEAGRRAEIQRLIDSPEEFTVNPLAWKIAKIICVPLLAAACGMFFMGHPFIAVFIIVPVAIAVLAAPFMSKNTPYGKGSAG
jgi:hypothetical protein